ncbi:MAG: NAD(P)-dependent oxidoreductase [Gammaproteobacteria bacterium]|jgi:nucleoside-diphosphate-sugar epimerase|nr:NAD(P)-dependent oxidoreductase [Gammaproteobacteria bacterium]|tara:strand:- start:2628 stop:3533 length:906 start_codon:yes stop_codon:yes gene_type:complete
MKILITGASGFIGSAVVKTLLEQNINFTAIGRSRPKHVDDSQFMPVDLTCHTITSLTEIIERAECTHLLHLAWYVEPSKFWSAQENMDWVAYSITLFSAFHKAGGRTIVSTGSCAEYTNSNEILYETESDASPNTLYGTAKLSLKNVASAWALEHSVDFRWARIFFAYGPGMPNTKLIPSLIRSLNGTEPLFSVNASDRRDFIYIDDIAKAILCLLASPKNGTFNVCSQQGHSVFEILDVLRELTGYNVEPIKTIANKSTSNTPIIGSNSHLKEIGWQPHYDLVSGLSEMITAHNITAAGI